MNILYIITILIIYILFMLIHKTDKKQNLILWSAISCILILCYNIFSCLIITLLNLLCTLGNLSIFNAIIILILLAVLLKNKKIQKYYFKISDLAVAILFLLLVIFVAYKQYGFPFAIKYRITDGSTHYFFAQQFYENSTLLYKDSTDDLLGFYKSDFRLPGAYINEGILFKVFSDIAPNVYIFILFDLFILYLSGILFYYLLKRYSKENKILIILAIIFSIVYMLGYPLNNMLSGFVYLSLALDIIIAFLILMVKYQKEEIENSIALPILSLVSFGIFFSYAYFVPIIYIAIIVNAIIKAIKNKEKIINIKNITELVYLILIPMILGITYFITFPLISGMQTEVSTIGADGAIYENYITNYLAFIPILCITITLLIINKRKTQKEYLPACLLAISIIFAIILFIGNRLEIVSDYYFFKSYNIIWLFTIYNIYISLTYLLAEKYKSIKKVTYIYTGIYIILIITSTLIIKNNIGINDIFYENVKYIEKDRYLMTNQEIKILDRIENLTKQDTTYILAPKRGNRMQWLSILLHNQYIYIDYIVINEVTIEKWLEEREEKYYIAYHADYLDIQTEKDYLEQGSDKYEIIYNDEFAFILERK